MLCQLVCIDRRYQRMNCFNIRELQGILKRKFFADLVNTSDFRQLLDSSMIGLRFKTGDLHTTTPNSILFYNCGLTNLRKTKPGFFVHGNTSTNTDRAQLTSGGLSHQVLTLIQNSISLDSLYSGALSSYVNTNGYRFTLTTLIYETLTNPLVVLYSYSITSLNNLPIVLGQLPAINTPNVNYTTITKSLAHLTANYSSFTKTTLTNDPQSVNLKSETFTGLIGSELVNNLSENSKFRFTRTNNPYIKVDYKSGNYLLF